MEEKTIDLSISKIEENKKDEHEKFQDEPDFSIILNSEDEKDNDEDLIKLLDNILNIEKENNNIAKLEKSLNKQKIKAQTKQILEPKKLKFKEDKLSPLLIDLFLKAYKIINNKNFDIKEEEDDDEDKKKEKNYILKLIEQINLEEKNNNCLMSIKYSKDEECKFTNRIFNIYLYISQKISKFHGLLNIKITFKVALKMEIRSGNVELFISKCYLNYENNTQKIIMNPNITILLINNNLGNYSVTYCTCGDCMKCKNRKEKKPFDDILFYLKKKNKINEKLQYTQLFYGKFNRYRNESGYKCSFCKDFYNRKSNIVKLFCNPDYDSDHTCQFWTCKKCYFKNKKNTKDEVCPNCGKFMINFSNLIRIFYYLRWKRNQLLEN